MSKRKKVNKPIFVEDVLNIQGVNLPDALAKIAREYYEAFLKQGFSSQQSYELMFLILRGYVVRV